MAATKRKVVEKSRVGEKPAAAVDDQPQQTAQTQDLPESNNDQVQETQAPTRTDTCVFVKLSDGVFVDLMEIQAYTHEEGTMGRVFLKGGNNFQTPCGDELIKRLREFRLYN